MELLNAETPSYKKTTGHDKNTCSVSSRVLCEGQITDHRNWGCKA